MANQVKPAAARDHSKLSITALYTSAAWHSAALSHADIFFTKQAKDIYAIVNGALSIARFFGGKGPSLPRSLLFRHEAIDRIIIQSGIKNIVELAAGLSARGLRMSEYPDVTYTEVDLPHLIAFKETILAEAMAAGRLKARANLRLVSRDIMAQNLADFVDPGNGPVALVAEGFVMYLTDSERLLFLEKCAALMAPAPGGLMVFDFVPPGEKQKPGFLGKILERLMKLFTAGRSFEPISKTREEIRDELFRVGFHAVEFVEPDAAQKKAQKIELLLFVCRMSPPFLKNSSRSNGESLAK